MAITDRVHVLHQDEPYLVERPTPFGHREVPSPAYFGRYCLVCETPVGWVESVEGSEWVTFIEVEHVRFEPHRITTTLDVCPDHGSVLVAMGAALAADLDEPTLAKAS